MPFSGKVGGGGPGARGAHYKKQTYFWKGKRARGPPTKNAYFGRVGREGLGARGVPALLQKDHFLRGSQDGGPGAHYKKDLFGKMEGGARGLRGPYKKRPFSGG